MNTAYGIALVVGILLVLVAPAIYRHFHNRKFAYGQTRIVKMDDGTYRIQVWITSDKEPEDVHILNRFDTLDEAIEARKKYDIYVKEYYDLTHAVKEVA